MLLITRCIVDLFPHKNLFQLPNLFQFTTPIIKFLSSVKQISINDLLTTAIKNDLPFIVDT